VAQNVCTGVQSGKGQGKALEAAELSSQGALDANKPGYQVGLCINIDVLNSPNQIGSEREAGAKLVTPFHFSPRYAGREEELRKEIEAAWTGLP
jgi:hypothetical protein